MSERIHPFSCGTQKLDWKERNCIQCKKGYSEKYKEWNCDIEYAIDKAAISDGSLSLDIAKRMGWDETDPKMCLYLTWDCHKREQ